MNVTKPCTIYISFPAEMPRKFSVYRFGKLYYWRHLGGSVPRIKFNVPDPGELSFSHPVKVEKVTALEIGSLPTLPDYERNRFKDFRVVNNPNLYGTPARIFTGSGVIETGAEYSHLPDPVKYFILLHEVGHFYYKDESKCDTFALIMFLKDGYNPSTAYYTLETVLGKSKDNVTRLNKLFEQARKK